MELDKIDLIVGDVAAAAAFFADVLGLPLPLSEARFAEVDVGAGRSIMLSPDAMVPTQPARGVILHFRVDDLDEALERARSLGARVLLEPVTTDWGWESAMLAGPEGIVVDLYREASGAGTRSPGAR